MKHDVFHEMMKKRVVIQGAIALCFLSFFSSLKIIKDILIKNEIFDFLSVNEKVI